VSTHNNGGHFENCELDEGEFKRTQIDDKIAFKEIGWQDCSY